jgi:hypothetical protein
MGRLGSWLEGLQLYRRKVLHRLRWADGLPIQLLQAGQRSR